MGVSNEKLPFKAARHFHISGEGWFARIRRSDDHRSPFKRYDGDGVPIVGPFGYQRLMDLWLQDFIESCTWE